MSDAAARGSGHPAPAVRALTASSGPAVFLDRDGVLNEVVPRDGRVGSPRSLEELVLVPGAAAAVARLRARGLPVFVVSNQPDVARGLLSPDALQRLTLAIRERVTVDDWRYCPHDDADGCACRKPKPGLLQGLARDWDVDLAASYFVADSWKDMDAGRAAGCRTILIRRPYNLDATGGHEVHSLGEAVDVIIQELDGSYARRYLEETRRVLEGLAVASLDAMAAALAQVREQGGRIFFLGVGGGAAHASHAACDFRKLAGMEAYAAVDNIAELTARTNDEGWESVFLQYLRGSRLRPEDAVFVFSVGGGSGEQGISANLVHGLSYAKQVGARVFGVVGRDGGYTARVADHCVVVPTVNPATITPHTESMQSLVAHLLVTHPLVQRNAAKWESVSKPVP